MTGKDEEANTPAADPVEETQEDGGVEGGQDKGEEDVETAPTKHTSHIRNEILSPMVRWGVLIFLIGTFILLVFADFGSGVTAESIFVQDGEISERVTILNVSVVSSVGKLWEAGSYPLAIFIATLKNQ